MVRKICCGSGFAAEVCSRGSAGSNPKPRPWGKRNAGQFPLCNRRVTVLEYPFGCQGKDQAANSQCPEIDRGPRMAERPGKGVLDGSAPAPLHFEAGPRKAGTRSSGFAHSLSKHSPFYLYGMAFAFMKDPMGPLKRIPQPCDSFCASSNLGG